MNTDALILGGGPAGLAAAIALRLRGLSVLVVDPLGPGADKSCGEGLMPGAVSALARLGCSLRPNHGQPFEGISFLDAQSAVRARFTTGQGLGVRRTTLHRLLAERAQAAGATLKWKTRATLGPGSGMVSVDGEQVRYRWLIGADGEGSTVRRWAGLDRAHSVARRFGVRRHYRVTPWSPTVEVHWAESGQAYVTPVAPDCICIVFMTSRGGRPQNTGADELASYPALAAKLSGAAPAGQRRGAVSAMRRLRRVAAGNIALVGDASGSADAITGEGLAMSFQQALALADALSLGDLGHYQRAHARIAQRPRTMARLLLMMDRWPGLERLALRTLAATPFLFQMLLSAHEGAGSAGHSGPGHAPPPVVSLLRGGLNGHNPFGINAFGGGHE